MPDVTAGVRRCRVVTVLSAARRDVPHDLAAGIVLTAFLVPVGMAYAQASGVPPVYGLYATIVPLLVYAVVGPSRVLVLGPDSSLAPLIAATVLPLAVGDPARAVALAGAMAVGSGVLCLLAGLARFGFVTELLSMPVRYGYLNGIVVVVAVSQLPVVLGLDVDARSTVGRFTETMQDLTNLNRTSLAIGVVSFVTILLLRRFVPRIPGVLVAVAGSAAVVAMLDLEDRVTVVGRLPRGLPTPAIPELGWSDLGPVAVGALTVALVTMTDTSLLSRALAARLGERTHPDRELVALGAANIATGFTQGFSVSASSSRTPVALAAGARTQLTGVTAAVAIAVLLVTWPGALQHLPTATLAAVVIAAVSELFEVRGVVGLARTRPAEFWFSVVAFAGVVVLGVLWGVGLAVAISLLALVQRAWRPHTAVLARVDGMKGYHDVERHPEGRQVPGLLLYRFDAPLFFANAERFHDEVVGLVTERRATGEPIRWVVVTAEPMTDVDATADQVMRDLHRTLDEMGVTLAFAEMKGVVRDRLDRAGTLHVIGEHRFYPTIGSAVRAFVDETDSSWVDWEDEADPDPTA